MPLFAKPTLLGLAGALGLYGLGVLFANMYLQSRGVQARLHDAITHATGLPVTINRTYYTPWSGLAISGVAVPPVHPAMESPLISIESVKVSLSLSALLQGRIHIRDIILTNTRIVSRQKTDGSWAFNQRPEIAGIPPLVPSLDALPSGTVPPSPDTNVQAIPPRPDFIIEAFHIRSGSLIFYMADGSPGLELSGISLVSNINENGHAHGTFHAKKTSLGGVVRPTGLGGSFTWHDNQLHMPDINATWGGGLVVASFSLISSPVPSFTLNVTAENVSLASVAADAGFDPEGTDGFLAGTLTLIGQPGLVATYSGNARIHCSEARMLPIAPVRQLGDMLQIREFQMLELDTARAELLVADGKIRVEEITLATKNVILDARGDASFDGSLALQARFHISDPLRRRTAGILGKKFTASDITGFSHMPFTITGTIHHPKTDLLERIGGARLQRELGGLLKNILQLPSARGKAAPTPDESKNQAR